LPYLFLKQEAAQSNASTPSSADVKTLNASFLMQKDQAFTHSHALFELIVTERKKNTHLDSHHL